jgi:hypothetical protein
LTLSIPSHFTVELGKEASAKWLKYFSEMAEIVAGLSQNFLNCSQTGETENFCNKGLRGINKRGRVIEFVQGFFQ